jgi:predicted nucleotide-binding protein/O-acetyl-ADP-ribose deacetylase (regulator of RNase III)
MTAIPSTRPVVFLASSTSAKALMANVAQLLRDCGLTPLPWTTVGLFRPGDFILERLLHIAGHQADASIILFTADDRDWHHKHAEKIPPRDNVLIEYGIFASRLGRDRTIVCRGGASKTASDLGGLIFLDLGKGSRITDDAKERLQHWAKSLPQLIAQAREREAKELHDAKTPLPSRVDVVYAVPKKQTLSVVTGSLRDLHDIDVIVSSENTNLEPSRIGERSMSATLRYFDAERNKSDQRVRRDAYLEALQATIAREDVQRPVALGSVIAAETTGLRNQGVQYVFHAAVVQPEIESGYSMSERTIALAVANAFERFAELAPQAGLKTILFPLFGAGSAGLAPDVAAPLLLNAILDGLRRHAGVKRAAVFAFVASHRLALRAAAQGLGLKQVASKR